MRKKERNKLILERLEETYKGQGTALHYTTPFELLVAVILSAQCTDERVNIVTKHAISLLRAENLLMTSIPRFLRR